MKSYLIYGASGHAKVIVDIIKKCNCKITAFLDDDRNKWNDSFLGYKILGDEGILNDKLEKKDYEIIVAIGDNYNRKKVVGKLNQINVNYGILVHPSTQIAEGVKIGIGTVIMANAVINSGTIIGEHCIINTSASVDHDNFIGDFVHISPGAHLGGGVSVDELTWIGLGASVINNIKIGKNAIIGAGAVVLKNVNSSEVVVGNPAKLLRRNK
jgi:sugar O-acyltransferase (sialic acid O-acetyltransferase NeuD family)